MLRLESFLSLVKATPNSLWFWSVPILMFYTYVITLGYPPLAEIVALAAAVGSLELIRVFPPTTSYRAGLGLLVSCPLWMIIDVAGLLGRCDVLYALSVKMHMSVGNEVAAASADEAFAFLVVGTSLAATRRASLDR